MRISAAVFLAFFAAQPGAAADAQTIDWSPARPLTWADFQGSTPDNAAQLRVASTTASLSWSFQYEIQWSPTSCLFRITHIDSVARFHPDTSWVRTGHQTTDVLQHEQGHFDLAEIHKVAFEAQTQDLVDTSRKCRGRSERQANQNAERELSRLIGSIYDEVWQQLQSQQNAYDTETRHGIDADAQARWTRKIADSLQIGN